MTAALYAGRSMLRTVVLERGAPGGELLNTEMIEDYPGFEHVLGWELAQKFESHAKKFGAEFRTAGVTAIRKTGDMFECVCDSGETYRAPAVIITAGGTPIKLGIPGEMEYRSEEHTSELQSLAYLVCRLLLEKKKKTKRNINKIKK